MATLCIAATHAASPGFTTLARQLQRLAHAGQAHVAAADVAEAAFVRACLLPPLAATAI